MLRWLLVECRDVLMQVLLGDDGRRDLMLAQAAHARTIAMELWWGDLLLLNLLVI